MNRKWFLLFFMVLWFTNSSVNQAQRKKEFTFLLFHSTQMCGQCMFELTTFFKKKKQKQTIVYKDSKNELVNSHLANLIKMKYADAVKCEVKMFGISDFIKYENVQFPFVLRIENLDTSYIAYSRMFDDFSPPDYKNWKKLFLH